MAINAFYVGVGSYTLMMTILTVCMINHFYSLYKIKRTISSQPGLKSNFRIMFIVGLCAPLLYTINIVMLVYVYKMLPLVRNREIFHAFEFLYDNYIITYYLAYC